jgi:hypothetical protein
MSFKFSVGEAVEYARRGEKVGLFTVTRQMPEELRAFDRQYRIKNGQGMEWSVLECELSTSDKRPDQDPAAPTLRKMGRD